MDFVLALYMNEFYCQPCNLSCPKRDLEIALELLYKTIIYINVGQHFQDYEIRIVLTLVFLGTNVAAWNGIRLSDHEALSCQSSAFSFYAHIFYILLPDG